MTKYYFDHEKLLVYQKAVEFVKWADNLIRKIKEKASVKNHLDEASTSIPLNIAKETVNIQVKTDVNILISRGDRL